MDSQDIAPVRYMAGLDLDNGPAFPLLTVEQAELGPTFPVKAACVSQPTAALYGAVPGATPTAGDPCLKNATPQACADAFNTGKQNCGWNVIPNVKADGSPADLTSNPPAPTRLCQAQNLGSGGNGGDVGGSLVAGFGNASEFQMEWAIPTHRAYFLQMTQGYVGHMTWTYLTPGDGKSHYYDVSIGHPVQKDGANYTIDWSDSVASAQQGDELYRGISSTFAPDIYDNAPAGVTLVDTGTGFVEANVGGGSGEVGMRPTSFYIVFFPNTLGAAEGVTVLEMYAFNIKYAPYSGAVSTFNMYSPTQSPTDIANAEPFASALIGSAGPNGAPVSCTFGIGDTFENLLNNCIDVFAVSAAAKGTLADPNVIAENKVLGGATHDDQNYTFNVVGIGQNFRPTKLDVCTPALTAAGSNCGTDIEDVVHDTDSLLTDAKNATANMFQSDVRSFGAITNDSYPPGTPTGIACTAATAATDCAAAPLAAICDTSGDANNNTCVTAAWNHDYHGGGAIWREYGRLVQADLNAKYVAMHGNDATLVKSWHDPSCFLPEACNNGTGADPATCATDKGTWGAGPTMEMSPPTNCTLANAATVCNQPGATCNQLPTANGLTVNTCVVPMNVSTWRPALGCTGFESLIAKAEKRGPPYFAATADDIFDSSHGSGAMKPGDPTVTFCNDPGTFNFCNTAAAPGTTDLLTVSTAQVLAFLGQGDVLNLPLDGRDKRYFFQQWSTAYAKYLISPAVTDTGLKSAGAILNGTAFNGNQVRDFSAQYIDTDNFIFDSFGGGAARSEFIAFDTADLNNDPVGVEQKILILGSNLQNTNFYRKLDREERAIFNSLAIDQTQAAWGYLRDGATPIPGFLQDTYVVGSKTGTATTIGQGTACTAATAAVCTALNPNAVCDTTAGDANFGQCVLAFSRHNANPFLSNLAGSPMISSQAYVPPSDANGNMIPAPAGWQDPCNPVSNPPVACTADTDCPGTQTAGPPTCTTGDSGTADCSSGAPTCSDGSAAGCASGFAVCIGGQPACALATFMSCGKSGTCGPAKTAYYCATHLDADCDCKATDKGNCHGANGGYLPPLNDDGTILTRANGKPLYEGYCSAFGQPTSYTIGGASAITVTATFPDLGEAFVSLPVYANPYGPGAAPDSTIQVMVPWLPFQEGVGFPVPNGATGGSQDVFVQTAQLDFTGQVITPVMDYLPVPSNGNDPNPLNPAVPFGVSIEAWETQDFLGEVFLCYDSTSDTARTGTGRPGDILSAHMYSSAATIVDWLSNHPGAQTACQVVVRYSPFNNYPDYITSLAYGVRLGIDQGFGFGRVVDATVFAPGTGSAAIP